MWEQCDEPPDGGVVDELPEGGFDDPFVGGGAGDPLGVSVVAEVEPFETVVVEAELPVAALATAAPPATRAPVSTTAAAICRRRIFIAFTSSRGACGDHRH
jgi:hypothetical protein